MQVTSSTYEPLNNCLINLEHSKSGKELNSLLEASYQGKNVTLELWHSSAKTKEGHVRLTTPFEALRKIYSEYRLHLAKEIRDRFYKNSVSAENFLDTLFNLKSWTHS
jgi:hypothetical protein